MVNLSVVDLAANVNRLSWYWRAISLSSGDI